MGGPHAGGPWGGTALDGGFEHGVERAAGPAAGAGGLPVGFAAALATRSLPRFAPGALIAGLNTMLGGEAGVELIPELTRVEQSPGYARVWHRPKVPPRIGVAVAGITLVVEGHDRPAFRFRGVEALEFRSWPAGAHEVTRARAHLRVFEPAPELGADLDLNHDRAAAVSAVAGAAAELVETAAVVWESSGVAVPADELAAALADGAPPVALWIGAVAAPWGGVVTRGLYPLLGAEIEVRTPALSVAAARELALRLASEILETGRPPAEGARIGHGLRSAFRVRYRGAEQGGAPAVVLEEAAPGDLDLAAGAA